PPSLLADHVERLRAGHFVNQVQPHEQLGLTARQRTDGVRVPDVFEKSSHEGLTNHIAGRKDDVVSAFTRTGSEKNPNAGASLQAANLVVDVVPLCDRQSGRGTSEPN